MQAFGLTLALPSSPLGIAAVGLVAAAVVGGLWVLTDPGGNEKARLRERMRALGAGSGGSPAEADDAASELLRKRPVGNPGRLQSLVVQAGGTRVLPMSILAGLAGAIAAYALAAFAFSPPLPVGLVCAAAGFATGATALLKRVVAKRKQNFLDNFSDAIDLIVRAVRAGIPVTDTISLVATEGAPPVSTEFQAISEEMSVGVDMQDAFTNAVHRIGIPDFNFFVVSLLLQRETGGHLAETLENLSGVVRRRKEMRLKIKALTSEGRISAKILSAMPVLTIAAITTLQPDYMLPLIEDPTGRLIFASAGTSIAFGIFLIYRMTKVPD